MGGCGSKTADGDVVDGVKSGPGRGQTKAYERALEHSQTLLKIELEAKEARAARAATRIQSLTRGKQGRSIVPPLKQNPCNRYRVNVEAERFGDCLCGWTKAEHNTHAFDLDPHSAKAKRLNSNELRNKMAKKEYATCDEYLINMNAENFGDCLCGKPKSEHKASALQGEQRGTPTIVDSEEVRARFAQNEATTTCTKYRVNVQAENYGECVTSRIGSILKPEVAVCLCGRPKSEHAASALNYTEMERQARQNDTNLRDGSTSMPFIGEHKTCIYPVVAEDAHTPVRRRDAAEVYACTSHDFGKCCHKRRSPIRGSLQHPDTDLGQCRFARASSKRKQSVVSITGAFRLALALSFL
eukprot:4894959-Pleurochrysis_carterae.AAC.3